jgi:hypothetical protein
LFNFIENYEKTSDQTKKVIIALEGAKKQLSNSITSRLEKTITKPRVFRLAQKLELTDRESVSIHLDFLLIC